MGERERGTGKAVGGEGRGKGAGSQTKNKEEGAKTRGRGKGRQVAWVALVWFLAKPARHKSAVMEPRRWLQGAK